MHSRAPRLPIRLWHSWARGALLAPVLWAACRVPATADTVLSAQFTEPTTRYPHGVLGDNIEYGALEITVESSDGNQEHKVLTIRVPQNRVFEDIAPRLADVDLDGHPEVIVVESDADQGAQLAIYDAQGAKIANTPPIGTRFRWIAPIGATDLDDDGYVEVAYIDRPHLARTLRIWRFANGTLTEIATLPGLTNHRIGEDFISGGIRDCGAGPELIVASADWHHIVSVRFDEGWSKEALGRFSRDAMDQAMACGEKN